MRSTASPQKSQGGSVASDCDQLHVLIHLSNSRTHFLIYTRTFFFSLSLSCSLTLFSVANQFVWNTSLWAVSRIVLSIFTTTKTRIARGKYSADSHSKQHENYWSVFLLQLCVTENGLSSEQSREKYSVDSHSSSVKDFDQYFFYNSVWLKMGCHQNSPEKNTRLIHIQAA